jgi:hypothetical protein
MLLKRWLLRGYYTCTAVLSAVLLGGLLFALMAGRHAAGPVEFPTTRPQTVIEAARFARAILVGYVWPCLVRSGPAVAGTIVLLLASVWLLDHSIRSWRGPDQA